MHVVADLPAIALIEITCIYLLWPVSPDIYKVPTWRSYWSFLYSFHINCFKFLIVVWASCHSDQGRLGVGALNTQQTIPTVHLVVRQWILPTHQMISVLVVTCWHGLVVV